MTKDKILSVISNRSYTTWTLIREMKEAVDSTEDEKLIKLYSDLVNAWKKYDQHICKTINGGTIAGGGL